MVPLLLNTESWGHEYSRRASVRVPISQLRSHNRLVRETTEERETFTSF